MNLTGRETEIIRILHVLGESTTGFVVIGGYAVNAFGQHRFSVDLDLVTNDETLPTLERVLNDEGYKLSENRAKQPRGVNVKDYRKSIGGENASVELFVNTVVSRTTKGTWTHRFVHKNSSEEIVVGATESVLSRVADRNLLVAMKLHAGRSQDFGDIVMLSRGTDWKKTSSFCATGSKQELLKQIKRGIQEITSPKFVTGLRSNFAQRSDPISLVKEARSGLESLTRLVTEKEFRAVL